MRLVEWLDREGQLSRETRHLGPALKRFGLDAFRPAQIETTRTTGNLLRLRRRDHARRRRRRRCVTRFGSEGYP
jgi:hypothetical protein